MLGDGGEVSLQRWPWARARPGPTAGIQEMSCIPTQLISNTSAYSREGFRTAGS